MMMQMLEAGGLEVLHDPEFRPADERNPRGYYETKPALSLGGDDADTGWVAGAAGKAVKVIAYQLKHLPPEFEYRVVFIRRRAAEVLASSGEFKLLREDSPLSERDKILAYKTEYAVYEAWLLRQTHMQAVFVSYNDVIDDPVGQAAELCRFLDAPPAPPLSAEAMGAAVDRSLYRQRLQV
jgi:hypothetical protein